MRPRRPTRIGTTPADRSTQVEDAGWVKEGQGSVLAREREGVPEGRIPESMAESAAEPLHTTP